MIKGQLIWQFDTENIVLSDVHCKTHLAIEGETAKVSYLKQRRRRLLLKQGGAMRL